MNIFRKHKKIRHLDKELQIEEVFLDNFVKKQEKSGAISERKIELPLKRAAFLVFSFFGFIVLSLLWVATFDLQVRGYDEYIVLSQSNKYITMKILAERGVIYDRNRVSLVSNEIRFDLLIEGADEQVLEKVAEILGENKDVFSEQKVFQNLSHQELVLLEVNLFQLPGIKIEKHTQRKYSEINGLSHILGYMGKAMAQSWIGKEGVEKSYEELLKENKGILEIERSAQGETIAIKTTKEPSSGKNLVLSLDIGLQEELAKYLFAVMEEVGSESAVAVAMNPKTGEVLASVSLPFFDNNLFAQGISYEDFEKLNEDPNKPQLNRTISGLYPLGSVVKPIIGLAALEEGIIDEETTLYCPLELCLENKYTEEKDCFLDWEFHGWTDIKKGIAQSVNPFFYMIGGGYVRPDFADKKLPKKFDGLGVNKIKEYLELFGFGAQTGIDLPGENKGRVPSPEWKQEYFITPSTQKWYLGDTYNLSIGQGYLLATPMQVATAFSAIANKGTLLEPKLLKTVIDPITKEEEKIEPNIKNERFVFERNLEIIRQGMRMAVSSSGGSALMLNSLPVKAAAKTGTAQISVDEVYHNWIAVFAPYDEPEIVLVVLIERVEGMRLAAQKVAYETLNWYFSK